MTSPVLAESALAHNSEPRSLLLSMCARVELTFMLFLISSVRSPHRW